MVNAVVDLMLEGVTDEKVLQDAWNEMEVFKKLAMEDLGKRYRDGKLDDKHEFEID